MAAKETYIGVISWLAIASSLLFVYGFVFWEDRECAAQVEHAFYGGAIFLFSYLLYLKFRKIKFALLTLILLWNLTGDVGVLIQEHGQMKPVLSAVMLCVIGFAVIHLIWKKWRNRLFLPEAKQLP